MIKKNNNNKAEFELPLYDDSPISLMDIMMSFARQVKIIVIIPSVSCFCMIVYAQFFTKPTYVSTSKIMSSSGSTGSSQASSFAAQFGINLGSNQVDTKWVYPEIIKSRTIARKLLKKNFIISGNSQNKTLLNILKSNKEQSKSNFKELESKATKLLLDMISVAENIKTGILTLSVTASDPQLAKLINSAIIEALDSHQKEYNKSKTSYTRQFIEERILQTEKELMTSEESLKVFRDRNRRIENSPALQLALQRLNREVSVLTGVFTTLKQQYETTKIDELKESDYVIIVDPPEAPLYRSSPAKTKMVIMSIVLGFCLSLLIGLIREYLEKNKKVIKIRLFKKLIFKNLFDLIPERLKKLMIN